jgi:class 3 adenylate cyclase
VVTFLFTDVERSTCRWEADADAMRVALAAHDAALRAAIDAHGGFLFKHTGDGVCAAFASRARRWKHILAASKLLHGFIICQEPRHRGQLNVGAPIAR